MSKLTFKQYEEKALVTIKPHASKDLALADWALGLGGEIGEVVELLRSDYICDGNVKETFVAIAKEMGDVLWYVTALAAEAGLEIPDHAFLTATKIANSLQQAETWVQDAVNRATIDSVLSISSIQESIKHKIMHKEKKDVKNTMEANLQVVITNLALISMAHGFTIEDVAELNVAKLSHRYNQGKYSEEASEKRHEQEQAFESTDEYRRITANILEALNNTIEKENE